jgi:hypothetical protein
VLYSSHLDRDDGPGPSQQPEQSGIQSQDERLRSARRLNVICGPTRPQTVGGNSVGGRCLIFYMASLRLIGNKDETPSSL